MTTTTTRRRLGRPGLAEKLRLLKARRAEKLRLAKAARAEKLRLFKAAAKAKKKTEARRGGLRGAGFTLRRGDTSISARYDVVVSTTGARKDFSTLVNEVTFAGHYVVLQKHGKSVAAIVPFRVVELLREIEDEVDLGLARESLAEGGKNVTLDELKAELGL